MNWEHGEIVVLSSHPRNLRSRHLGTHCGSVMINERVESRIGTGMPSLLISVIPKITAWSSVVLCVGASLTGLTSGIARQIHCIAICRWPDQVHCFTSSRDSRWHWKPIEGGSGPMPYASSTNTNGGRSEVLVWEFTEMWITAQL